MEFAVINRPLLWLDRTFEPGDVWPLVDVDNRADARSAKLLYTQRRIAPNPAWVLKNVPSGETLLTVEELAAADKAIAAEVLTVAESEAEEPVLEVEFVAPMAKPAAKKK